VRPGSPATNLPLQNNALTTASNLFVAAELPSRLAKRPPRSPLLDRWRRAKSTDADKAVGGRVCSAFAHIAARQQLPQFRKSK
jgi:hypothetical protein